MADSFFSSMYGGNPRDTDSPPKPATPAAVPMAQAHKMLGGLKITGSHIKRIVNGDQVIDVPSAEYVKLLEEQIRELRHQLRDNENKTRRLTNAHNKVLVELERIRQELKTKITLR